MKLANLPLLGRFAVVGAGSAGAAGAVAGLTIGLIVYAPTAPFALVELSSAECVVTNLLCDARGSSHTECSVSRDRIGRGLSARLGKACLAS